MSALEAWRRVRPMVGVAFILLWLMFTWLVGAKIVFGQTPTPTVTPINTPPITPIATLTPFATATVGPTPTLIPDSSGSTVVWGCILTPLAAPVCKWGDYFEMYWFQFAQAPPGGQIHDWPGPGQSDYATLAIIPPADTKTIHATCTYHLAGVAWRHSSGASGPGVQSRVIFSTGSAQSWGGSAPVSPDLAVIPGAGLLQQAVGDERLLTQTVIWQLDSGIASWPGANNFPTNETLTVYARVAARQRVTSGNPSGNAAQGMTRVACQIDEMVRLDDSTYVPSNPVVGDGPTPTPCLPSMGCWQVGLLPITPYPIGTIAVPTVQTTVTFGIGAPATPQCNTIIPSTNQTLSTWFGDIPYGFDGVQACTTERELNLVIDEFNIGQWAIGLIGFMGVGVLWLMLRR